MSFDAVCELLKRLGGREYLSSEPGTRMFGFGRVQGPKCLTNERPPEVMALAYPDILHSQGTVHPGSVVFTLFGEMPEQWCDLHLYAIAREEVETRKDAAFRALEVMWRAGFAVMKRAKEDVVRLPED